MLILQMQPQPEMCLSMTKNSNTCVKQVQNNLLEHNSCFQMDRHLSTLLQKPNLSLSQHSGLALRILPLH